MKPALRCCNNWRQTSRSAEAAQCSLCANGNQRSPMCRHPCHRPCCRALAATLPCCHPLQHTVPFQSWSVHQACLRVQGLLVTSIGRGIAAQYGTGIDTRKWIICLNGRWKRLSTMSVPDAADLLWHSGLRLRQRTLRELSLHLGGTTSKDVNVEGSERSERSVSGRHHHPLHHLLPYTSHYAHSRALWDIGA